MARVAEVQKHYGKLKFYINGEWVEPESTQVHDDYNPATGEVIAQFCVATAREIEAAIAAAQSALTVWRGVALRDKARLLFDLRAAFETHLDRLTRVLVQDHGRTLGEARGTLRRCIENIESACAALLLLTKGEYVNDLARGIDQSLIWEPRGVFLIVTPNNIPMHAWSSFVPYALACGCPVIVSPSKDDPVCLDAIFKVCETVGFPPGLINLLYGGRHINQTILRHPVVKGVGFIGSTPVGRELFQLAGELGKEASINGNGKNHVVIMPDSDPAQVADALLRSCYGMAGQRCLGSDNVVVVGDVYDAVKAHFVKASAAMKLGYGLDESTELGPLVSARGFSNVLDFIDLGLKEGARMVLDGRNVQVLGCENGWFVGPTILEDVDIRMQIALQESFGPAACLMRARDLDEALDWINNSTNYGHSACIFTHNGHDARRFLKEADVGNVGINVAVPQPYAFFPLGSKNESAFGCAKSRIDSIRLFLNQKTVTERWY